MGEILSPVFVFLPVRETAIADEVSAVDPVCGRAVGEGRIAGRLLYNGKQHYFCSLDCAQRFARSPGEFGPE